MKKRLWDERTGKYSSTILRICHWTQRHNVSAYSSHAVERRRQPAIHIHKRERAFYSQKTQADWRTIGHRSCSLYSNNQLMRYTLDVAKNSIHYGQNKDDRLPHRRTHGNTSIDWLSCGLTPRSTQNRSFRRRFSKPVSWRGMETKLNLTRDKSTHSPIKGNVLQHKINTQKN